MIIYLKIVLLVLFNHPRLRARSKLDRYFEHFKELILYRIMRSTYIVNSRLMNKKYLVLSKSSVGYGPHTSTCNIHPGF